MIKFGTGGWRAFIGEEFTAENVRLVSQAIANLMKEKNVADSPFVIGYDRRFLSDKAARWMAEVLAGNGIKVELINKAVPTPIVMFCVKDQKLPYGACITASHNPADYNGIKFFTEGGRDATETMTDTVEEYISKLSVSDVLRKEYEDAIADGSIEIIRPINQFVDSVIGAIDVESIKKANLRVLLDPMFGVAKTSLQTVLISARCDVDVINDRHDTTFGGRLPSPSAHTLYNLSHLVPERGYDIGIGTDGDADRLGIIDEQGRFVHPNEILVLLYYYLLRYKGQKGSVVRNIATTHLLDKIAEDHGEKCIEVPVGFKHISAGMDENDSLIGGESSGGLTIRGHIKGKDGIFAGSLLVELISVTGKKLSEILDEIYGKYGTFVTAEGDCTYKANQRESLWNMIYEEKKLPEFNKEIDKVSYADGAKVYFKDGSWVIARFSGTEPLLRIFAEASTLDEANALVQKVKDFLSL
ncbi:phosphoglucomutase/phosphomannomutase family protein [Teredinibacter sp. KSP-S5-2]|uniref:phosphoglucomutase/phosphomannomutase family protein n=1 Tax=Teredinibacter sp. KSP-S5-2 TaxID=3034506 RepID=UPI00293424AB|nr:phosphoglucomutase/phosphomannomutase family protein [Teredinibacter sp. KSP-S5-2]WNO09764.1 phosphoglucomutase/phosphomannomutase family protein [Teredinibacter sp. KSP-S5-2]